jgi:hypothetical protein
LWRVQKMQGVFVTVAARTHGGNYTMNLIGVINHGDTEYTEKID